MSNPSPLSVPWAGQRLAPRPLVTPPPGASPRNPWVAHLEGHLLIPEGMAGRVHQSLLWLFRRDMSLAIELADRAAGRGPSVDARVSMLVDRSGVLQRVGLRDDDGRVLPDLLLTVHGHPSGPPGLTHAEDPLARQVWIVEVQLGRDRTRAQSWAESVVAAAREFELRLRDVELLIVSPSRPVRGWIRRELLPDLPRRTCLLEPVHVPRIRCVERARGRPTAAVLSAVFHGREPTGEAIVFAACQAIRPLPRPTRRRYRYLIETAAHPAMELPPPVDPVLSPEPEERPSDWELGGLTWAQHGERFTERGLRQGVDIGMARAYREGLRAMLQLLGHALTPAQEHQLSSCDVPERLHAALMTVRDGGCPESALAQLALV